MFVAPPPRLARLGGLNHRMTGRAGVSGCMAGATGVAASDVITGEAGAQEHDQAVGRGVVLAVFPVAGCHGGQCREVVALLG